MEQFTNNRIKYWERIVGELSTVENSSELRFQYVEVGQLFSHGYSISQKQSEPEQLIVKVWNAGFDNKRFNKGLYNLDRLAITDIHIDPSKDKLQAIDRLLNSNCAKADWGGIVLDGLYCHFLFGNQKFIWNADEEMNESLSALIKLLRKICE